MYMRNELTTGTTHCIYPFSLKEISCNFAVLGYIENEQRSRAPKYGNFTT